MVSPFFLSAASGDRRWSLAREAIMATVYVPPMMRRLTDGVESVLIEGKNLREIVNGLEERFPGTREWLCEGDRLRPGVAAAVDGETARMGLIQSVNPDSEVHFLPAFGGGLDTAAEVAAPARKQHDT